MGNASSSGKAIAILFIAVMSMGFAGAVIAIVRWSPPGPTDRPVSAGDSKVAGLVDGSISERVEAEIDAQLPLRTPAIHALATIRYLLFRTGNDGVVVGRDGWLYTREEFEHHQSDAQVLGERLAFIYVISNRLAQMDVELLVAIVPSKARIVPEPLSGRWQTLANHPRYYTALGLLEANEVMTADLRPALESIADPFLQTDTHWSAQGARLAAQAVADAADRLGLADGLIRTEFATAPAEEVAIGGDLLSFLPVGPMASILGLPEESITRNETVTVSAPTLGLFDAPTIAVTLVGTSYSVDERWNFVGELKQALHSDVLNISTEAVGPFVPMAEYLAGSAFAEVRPQLVIWEIPERYLTLPDMSLPKL